MLPEQAREEASERRHVTVIFADVAGFTALSSQLDPEEVTTLMNRCFQAMVAPVEQNGGYVDKFIGDCVMALFGAPVAHEDDEVRAVRAALGMREGIASLSASLGRELAVTIGVNTGLAIAGRMGAGSRRDYTVMGDAVNVAQRIQAAARSGQVLLGEATANACRRDFELAPHAPIHAKGKALPVEVEEAVRARPREVQVAYELPIVGRDPELALLDAALGSAAAGRGAAVGLVGDAGSGKTRLAEEVGKRARARGFQVLAAQCEEHLRHVPHLPLRHVLCRLAGVEPGEEGPAAERRLLALAERGATRAELELLVPLLPGSTAPEPPRRGALVAAFAGLLRWTARSAPLAIVVEDLHAADEPSRALLGGIQRALGEAPVLLVATSRPDVELPFGDDARLHRLLPLEGPAAAELVGRALGARDADEDVCGVVLPRAEGNPLFIEQLARALLEAEAVRVDDGVARLSSSESRALLPQTLRGLLLARMDRLPLRARDALRDAAVLGRSFRAEVLGLVSSAEAVAELPGLARAGYLVAEAVDSYRFSSPLLQEAAYGSLLFADRRRLHTRTALALEKLELPAGERVFLLAHHYARSERLDSALHYVRLAAERAVRESDFRGALAHCDTARRLREEASPSPEDELALRKVRLRALKALGELDVARDEARALADGAAPALRAWALFHLGELEAWRGEYPAALEHHREGLRLAAEAADTEMLAKLEGEAGWILAELGRTSEAAEHLDRALAFARSRGDRHAECAFLNHRGIAALRADDVEAAARYFTTGLSLAEAEHARSYAHMLLCNLGLSFAARGRDDKAAALFERAAGVAGSIFDRRAEALCRHNWSAALLRLGFAPDARRLAEQSRATAAELGWRHVVVMDEAVVAGADALSLDEGALARMAASRREVEAMALPGDVVDLLLLEGRVLHRLARLDEACAVLEEAAGRAAGLGHRRAWLAAEALDAAQRARASARAG